MNMVRHSYMMNSYAMFGQFYTTCRAGLSSRNGEGETSIRRSIMMCVTVP